MAKFLGLETVLRNLKRELDKIEGKTLKGLIRGGIIVIRDTEDTSPKTPVDTGNLRASRFMVTSKGDIKQGQSPGFKGNKAAELSSDHNSALATGEEVAKKTGRPTVIIGYGANYAEAVHEDVGRNYRRPGSGAKFLEASLKRNAGKVLQVVAEEAKK
jgi:hypothetical protein